MAKIRVDLLKLRADVKRELQRMAIDGINKMPALDKQKVGEDLIAAMKDQIARGISPIANRGRFPAYKGVGKANKLRAQASAIKGNTSSKRSQRKELRTRASAKERRGYPYTVMHKFPGKRVRPVNLFLSGNFLSDLVAKALKTGIQIGFFTSKSSDIEEGHRTGGVKGVNDQPQRPIIPQGSETFSRSVYQVLLDSTVKAVIKRLETIYGRR